MNFFTFMIILLVLFAIVVSLSGRFLEFLFVFVMAFLFVGYFEEENNSYINNRIKPIESIIQEHLKNDPTSVTESYVKNLVENEEMQITNLDIIGEKENITIIVNVEKDTYFLKTNKEFIINNE